jgi:glycine betaine/proline transport system ATP-binding protein
MSIEIKNLSMIFGSKPEVEKTLNLIDQGLPIEDIKQETKTTIALNDVSFEIEDTELFVIVGLSGSGKSTLIRCLNRLNEPTRGEIVVNGEDIIKYDKKTLRDYRRNKISMVFQHFGLLSHRSIVRNVEYGLEVQGVDKKTRREKALQALDVVGLSNQGDKYPHEMSGGMKQRVGIARALISEPEILLMDEPYSALDPLIRRDMQNELLSLEDYINRTIVFITHDMNEAFKMGDRIALMKDGKIVQIGTPQEFFQNPANDYVKDFISDVDKTQIIKVRSVMNKKIHTLSKDISRSDAFSYLEKNNLDHIFITEDKKYVGMLTREDLAKSRSNEIDNLIVKVDAVYRNDYIKSLWTKLEGYDYSLPVVDSKGLLRGQISKDEMIKALA